MTPPAELPPADPHEVIARRRASVWTPLAGAAILLAEILYATGAKLSGNSTTIGIAAMPLLVLAMLPLITRTAKREPRYDLGGIMLLGLGLRLVGAFFRFRKAVDAKVYHEIATVLADHMRGLDFSASVDNKIPGTGSVRWITGLVEVFTGKSMFATFLVFTVASWIGCYFFFRAIETALPWANHERYAKLLFLWPSLIYWPSSIGKESSMLFSLGLAVLGASRMFSGRRGGFLLFAVGLAGATMVRPHVALGLLAATFTAYLFGGGERSRSRSRLFGRVAAVAVLVVGGAFLAGQTATLLNLDSTGSGALEQGFDQAEAQTGQGGSAFTPARVRTPLDLPLAFVTVMFRPFPIEAHSGEAWLSAIEGVILLALTGLAIARYRITARRARTASYTVAAAAFTIIFIFAFSVISNFGILVRQRTQVLPLFFVLLSLEMAADPARSPNRRTRGRRAPRVAS